MSNRPKFKNNTPGISEAPPTAAMGLPSDMEAELEDLYEGIKKKSVPPTFKVSRQTQLQLSKWGDTIFKSIEAKETGNYIISGLPRKITDFDFEAFMMAVGQILYNQSHQSGNDETNSGLMRQVARGMEKDTGRVYYVGSIVATLNDLCRKGYGTLEPTSQQKKAMEDTIEAVSSVPVIIDFPEEDNRVEVKLAAVWVKKTSKKTGAVTYMMSLNPIFCEGVKNNYSELPQDVMLKLSAATKRKTTAHLRLLRLLSLQNKNNTRRSWTLPYLVTTLGMEADFRKNRKRAEKQLLSICDDMVTIGILHPTKKYEVEYETKRGKRFISEIHFYLNRMFVRKWENPRQDAQPTESKEKPARTKKPKS